VFCGLPDQRLDGMPLLEVITPIEKCIGEFEPHVVFTHFRGDANQDHRAAFQATLVAARPLESSCVQRLLCYEVASSTEWAGPFADGMFAPNVFVDISSTLSTKIEAMRAYADTFSNELRPFPHPRSIEALEAIAARHGAASGVRAAESFVLVRQVVREGQLMGVGP
jgi:N-acetylglucosamine malate deacetylase 1